jgi:hypothetical protein
MEALAALSPAIYFFSVARWAIGALNAAKVVWRQPAFYVASIWKLENVRTCNPTQTCQRQPEL